MHCANILLNLRLIKSSVMDYFLLIVMLILWIRVLLKVIMKSMSREQRGAASMVDLRDHNYLH